MLMGGGSCSKGLGSNPSTVTGWTFFTFICCKNCNVRFEKTRKIHEKVAENGPVFALIQRENYGTKIKCLDMIWSSLEEGNEGLCFVYEIPIPCN